MQDEETTSIRLTIDGETYETFEGVNDRLARFIRVLQSAVFSEAAQRVIKTNRSLIGLDADEFQQRFDPLVRAEMKRILYGPFDF